MVRNYALFRYRFDSFDQVVRHLHVVHGVALIFVADPPSKRVEGKILLEMVVRAPAQQTVVRGEVVARGESGGLAAALRPAAGGLPECGEGFRRQARRAGELRPALQFRSASGLQLIGKLLDVGPGGMRVRGVPGMLLGETYSLRLLGAPPGWPTGERRRSCGSRSPKPACASCRRAIRKCRATSSCRSRHGCARRRSITRPAAADLGRARTAAAQAHAGRARNLEFDGHAGSLPGALSMRKFRRSTSRARAFRRDRFLRVRKVRGVETGAVVSMESRNRPNRSRARSPPVSPPNGGRRSRVRSARSDRARARRRAPAPAGRGARAG